MESAFFLVFLGVFSGIASSMFGIGGGTLIIPALMLTGLDITFAIGISIVQMIFASFFGSYLNFRKHSIPVKIGISLGIGGMLGSSMSGLVLLVIPEMILHLLFLCFTFFSFIKFFFSRKKHYSRRMILSFRDYCLLVIFGSIVGIFSSSLGIGGGLLLAPFLGVFLGINSKESIPLALFFICFSSISGAISLHYSGFLHLQKGIFIGIFAMIGVYIGNLMMQRISAKSHKSLLLLIYLFSMSATLFKIF